MHTTPISLLERLRRPDNEAAWCRFVELYTPLLYHWARRLGLAQQDASDLVQDVFATLLQKLPKFTYDRQKRFRGWLWTVTLNKFRENKRRWKIPTEGVSEGFRASWAASDVAPDFVEAEYRQYVTGRALEILKADFQPRTWKIFWELVTNGRSAPDVAAEFGTTVGAVYATKVRVMARLRRELDGLLE